MGGPGSGPAQRKPRDGFWLTAGLCVFLPASGLALRYWGHFLFAPEESASPLIEVSDRSRRGQDPSSLSYVRALPGASAETTAAMPPPAAQKPPPSSLDLIAKEPAGDDEQARQPPPLAPVVPKLPPARRDRRGYPKLKTTNGWRSWFTQPGDGIRTVFAPAAAAPELEGAPASSLQRPPPSAEPVADVAPPPIATPSAPRRQGYRPPPVVYSATGGGTEVGPGGPTGQLQATAGRRATMGEGATGRPDYTTFIGAPDRVPLANPVRPGPGGACPQASWWKNFYDGQCYQTRAACEAADYTHQGCAQGG